MGIRQTSEGAAAMNASAVDRRELLLGASIVGIAFSGGASASATIQRAGTTNRKDWAKRPFRLIQTNLREPDVRQDPRKVVRDIRDYGGDAILTNVGGIVSFYPSALEYQYQNPFLQPGQDYVAETIAAARAENLAVIGRFDLSKTMKKEAYQAHPEWFMLNRDGSPRIYAGIYTACPNGEWYQDYGLRILREGLERYDLDGLFFNASNPYGTTDYGGVDRGNCACRNCQRRFREMYGHDLPKVEGFSDPVWSEYLEFQERTADELTKQIYSVARSIRPNAAIMGRGNIHCDVLRNEVQRRVDRPAPEWPYQAGEHLREYAAIAPGKPIAATATTHLDYPWRQALESGPAHMLRFAQSLANGGALDLYLMGSFDDQEDKRFIPETRKLFHWYAANEARYAGLEPASRVALYHSRRQARWGGAHPSGKLSEKAWRGTYSALVDRRIPFWMVDNERVADGTTKLTPDYYDAIILPNVTILTDAEAAALDAYVAAGGLVIATGQTGGFDRLGTARPAMAMKTSPIARWGEAVDAHGWTFDVSRATGLNLDGPKIPVTGDYYRGTLTPDAANLLPRAPEQRFGPPEFSYAIPGATGGPEPGILVRTTGKGRSVHLPWHPDNHYYRDGITDHAGLFAGLLAAYAPPPPIRLEGPGAVELTLMRQPSTGRMLAHVINYSGQRGGLYDEPALLRDLRLGMRSGSGADALLAGTRLQPSAADRDGYHWVTLPPVRYFEAVSIDA